MASQDENNIANLVGSHAYNTMVECITVALCYGVALCLFYSSLRVSLKRETTSNARKFLLILTCFMFLLNTGLFATFIAYDMTLFSWAGNAVTQNTPALRNRLLASDALTVPYITCTEIFEILNFIAGDAIVVWRAAVLWPYSRLVQGGLCVLLVGDAVVSLYDLVTISKAFVHSAGTDYSSWLSIDTARILTSLGVNFLATLSIAVKTWQFRGTLRLSFSKATTKKSLAHQLLILMVECGLIFCAVQFFYAIFTLVLVPKSVKSSVMSSVTLFDSAMQPFFSFFAGMYPSIIILVMAEQRSIFGTSTFIAGSQDIPAANGADQQKSRAVSALHFATVQESTGQSDLETQTFDRSMKLSSKGGAHVAFTSDAEKAV